MTERFPEQRNRSAQRRADAPQVPASAAEASASLDDVLPVFDESFIAAAPVRELSAQARAAQARAALARRRRAQQSVGPSATLRSPDETPRRWAVRPSHHLSAVRLPAVAVATACALTVSALLFILLR